MQKISRLKIGGFRRLADVEFQTRRLMVLIGANGVGKTSVLDALTLLSASANGRLNPELSRTGGVASLLTRGKASSLSWAVYMAVPGHQPLRYEVSVEASGGSYRVEHETLSQQKGRLCQAFQAHRFFGKRHSLLRSPARQLGPAGLGA